MEVESSQVKPTRANCARMRAPQSDLRRTDHLSNCQARCGQSCVVCMRGALMPWPVQALAPQSALQAAPQYLAPALIPAQRCALCGLVAPSTCTAAALPARCPSALPDFLYSLSDMLRLLRSSAASQALQAPASLQGQARGFFQRVRWAGAALRLPALPAARALASHLPAPADCRRAARTQRGPQEAAIRSGPSLAVHAHRRVRARAIRCTRGPSAPPGRGGGAARGARLLPVDRRACAGGDAAPDALEQAAEKAARKAAALTTEARSCHCCEQSPAASCTHTARVQDLFRRVNRSVCTQLLSVAGAMHGAEAPASQHAVALADADADEPRLGRAHDLADAGSATPLPAEESSSAAGDAHVTRTSLFATHKAHVRSPALAGWLQALTPLQADDRSREQYCADLLVRGQRFGVGTSWCRSTPLRASPALRPPLILGAGRAGLPTERAEVID